MNNTYQSYIELNFKSFIKDLVLKILESDFNFKLYNTMEVIRSVKKHLLEYMFATFYGLCIFETKDSEKYNYIKSMLKE